MSTVRILVVAETATHREVLGRAVAALGHQVACNGAADVALVACSGDGRADYALGMIVRLVDEGVCPVVVHAPGGDAGFLAAAARAGVYGHTPTLDARALGTSIDVALRRFRDRAELEAVVATRMLIDRAKGILMERYDLDEKAAFEMLRREARDANLELGKSAEIVVRGHRLLPVERPRGRGRSRRRLSGPGAGALIGWLTWAQSWVAELAPSVS